MKKMLLLFLILDFVFVGTVMTLTQSKKRTVASIDEPTLDGLSEGQKNKWQLIQSFKFQMTAESIELQTDKLQMICDITSMIELRFMALNVAFDGMPPLITHTYSCAELKKNQSLKTLSTSIANFQLMHQQKSVTSNESQLTRAHIYSSEEFPKSWQLAEIKITGISNFTITDLEIQKVLQQSFNFNLATSAK